MTPDQIPQFVMTSAGACGLDPTIAYYQIQRESGFNPQARGGSGERGLAQFMPATWTRFGSGSFDSAFVPEYAMNAYCSYMGYLLGLFGGDYSKALTGYNGGEGHLTDPGRYGPPSAAALGYARDVLAQAGAGSPAQPGGASLPSGASTILILAALAGLGLIFFSRD